MLDILFSFGVATIAVGIVAILIMLVIKTHAGKIAAIAAAAFVLLVGAAAAGKAEEARKLEVIYFDFEHGEVVLVDNEGEAYACPFGTYSWELGENFTLILHENGEAEIIKGGEYK